ncbi:thiopurine S-methyltransferase [Nitrosomonas aestuarii]|uniref:Thiopurine S-methyltransferase n=1 Tax=Nitrosomonas aestuarii TaxID=52441 RepID=A0A1I4GIF9_9PROT|nr:thiopurine S-methyltransferase [Nitrosomonas aestuarii]SFL29077.1 thiopurine S-methyltransferase [Nitrosomonas aestuarii]
MKASFWHQKWEQGDIAFHESEVNTLLITHCKKLNLSKGSRVFLPLCGKTRDIAWMLACGYQVVGAELSELAINKLFDDLGVVPKISGFGELTLYRAKNIDIFVGNIFDVLAESLGLVDAVYDRAALVAMPANMRDQYTSHLMNITDAAPQLLITYEYNQQLMDGPPFSINEEELKHYYSAAYQIKPVESKKVAGGLKGKVASKETVWLLKKIN